MVIIVYDLDKGGGPKDSETAPNLFLPKPTGKGSDVSVVGTDMLTP